MMLMTTHQKVITIMNHKGDQVTENCTQIRGNLRIILITTKSGDHK